MDYLLADRWQVEAGGEAYCPEKVLRLPDGYVCFDPPADAPEVGAVAGDGSRDGREIRNSKSESETNPKSEIQNSKQASPPAPASLTPCPSPEYGRGESVVTFGSFNNPAKITPCVVAAWAEILRRVPGSRLVLKYQGFDQPGTRRHYEGLFAAGGVGPERLDCSAGRRVGGCWPSTTASIWSSIRFPIRAGSRPARRCGWGCR